MPKRTTIDALEEFLRKTRRRLSDENPDYSDMDEEYADPDRDYGGDDNDDTAGDAADEFIRRHEMRDEQPEEEPPEEYDDKPEDKTGDVGDTASSAPNPQRVAKPVAPTIKRKSPPVVEKPAPAAAVAQPPPTSKPPVQSTSKPSTPKRVVMPGPEEEDEFQPTREELMEMRRYTRPWEDRARAKAHLEAEAHVNPVKHHQGRIIEARNLSFADKDQAYKEFTSSPEYQNADPIEQMEMDVKFHNAWHDKNKDHLLNALLRHGEEHKKGEQARELFNAAQDAKIRHLASGGAQPGAYSTEEGLQHAGMTRDEDDTTPGGIRQDPMASFAAGNKEFLDEYMRNREKKNKTYHGMEDLENYDPGERADVERVIGQGQPLPPHVNAFIAKYHPYIQKAARHVLSKLGMKHDANSSDVDYGLLHYAGMHALFQAINDYDHDHPGKAKFTTHLSRKMHGLMMSALKEQDEIPAVVRAARKQFTQKQNGERASASHSMSPEEIENIKETLTVPGAKRGTKATPDMKVAAPKPPTSAPISPKRSVQEIAALHPPEVQDRLQRVAAARAPLVRRGVVPKTPTAPTTPSKGPRMKNVNFVTPSEDEGGEE